MDHLRMCDMEIKGYTGCLPSEKENGQVFVISIDMGFEHIPGAMTDELEGTVDYSALYEVVRERVASSRGNLIENLAWNIAGDVLAFSPLPEQVEVTVSKPQAPVDAKFRTMETVITRSRVREYKHQASVSCGSNVGDRYENLMQAVTLLRQSGHIVDMEVSPVYETEPVGYDNQQDFLNMCISFRTDLEPLRLLDLLQTAENALHRVRVIKNGPRTIDLDLLTYDDLSMEDERLILPHPRMHERAFVLRPLHDLGLYDGEIPEDKDVRLYRM